MDTGFCPYDIPLNESPKGLGIISEQHGSNKHKYNFIFNY
jgi:hypothetical protein